MRPGLAREIVRNATAYRAGRSLANALMVAYLGGMAIIAVSWTAANGLPQTPEAMLACAVPILTALLGGAVTVLIRELIHAVFDLADVALQKHTPEH